MIARVYRLLDALGHLQRTRRFKIVASIIVFAIVAGIYFLAYDSLRYLVGPHLAGAFTVDRIPSMVISAVVLLAVVWLDLALTALGIVFVMLAFNVPLMLMGVSRGELSFQIWAQVISGVGYLTIVFLMAVNLARLALSPRWPIFAVARLVIDESLRMKIALVFIAAAILLIPVLTIQIDPSARLTYRIQTFLSYGVGLSYAILAVMTVFVATATVAFEQRDRQIYQIVSKPISRFQYLIGKWIGVMALNLILLVVIGGAVFWFVSYLRTFPALGSYDRLAVNEQVLTARVGVRPTIPDFSSEALARAREEVRLDPTLENEPAVIAQRAVEVLQRLQTAERTLSPAARKDFTFNNLHPVTREERVEVTLGEIVPLEVALNSPLDLRVFSEDGSIEYAPNQHFALTRDGAGVYFATIEQQGDTSNKIVEGQRVLIRYYPSNALTLRFKIDTGDNLQGAAFPLTFGVGNIIIDVVDVVAIQTQTILIPAGLLENNSLTLWVLNGDAERMIGNNITITFPSDGGLELMYKRSEFAPNYARAMFIIWIKLGFLAMLGVAAASVASFPVACLLAFTIYFGAESAGYLTEALEFFNPTDPITDSTNYLKLLASWIATPTAFALKTYADIQPTQNLIEGRLVSWSMVGHALLVIALVWSGISLLIGWLVFRARQLALYSGH